MEKDKNIDKFVIAYLESLIFRGPGTTGAIVIGDIIDNAYLMKDPEKVFNRLINRDIFDDISFEENDELDVRERVTRLCRIATAIASNLNDKKWAARIMNDLYGKATVKVAPEIIAETYIRIADDKTMAVKVLKEAERYIKADIRKHEKKKQKRHSGAFARQLLTYARNVRNIIGDDKWADDLVEYAADYAEGFDEFIELANFFMKRKKDKDKALQYLARAKVIAKSFYAHINHASLVAELMGDCKHVRKLLKAVLAKAEDTGQICVVAEVISDPDGLHDLKWAEKGLKEEVKNAKHQEGKDCLIHANKRLMEKIAWKENELEK